MPIFKGRAGRAEPGKGIRYITNKRKASKISSIALDDNRSYIEQFKETANLFHKNKTYNERKYYHFKLSPDRADNASVEAVHRLAEDVTHELFHGHEAVIATHTDTDTVHAHIILNSVNWETGRKLHYNNTQYIEMNRAANRMAAERGMSTIEYPTREKSRTLTDRERHQQTRLGVDFKAENKKEKLRGIIEHAVRQSNDWNSFAQELSKHGVDIARKTNKTITYSIEGSFKVRGKRLGEQCDMMYLSKRFSRKQVRKR